MKVAVSGKGGVGKTTISASLIRYLAQGGNRVYAVDADPDVSLASVLGLPDAMAEGLKPIVEMREVIAEKTGGKGSFLTLNPQVDDLIREYCFEQDNIVFLKMGAVKQGGSSCYCRENSVLNALINTLLVKQEETVVLDMGAGIEHLTRGTARGVDAILVVTEPSRVSVQTSRVVGQLAGELGVPCIRFLGNKVRNERDAEFLRSNFSSQELIALIPFSEAVLDMSMGLGTMAPDNLQDAMALVVALLQKELGGQVQRSAG